MELLNGINVTSLSALVALLLSILAIIFSYKGVKVTKYIETITSQRIKWIGELRNDLSKVLTLAILFRKFKNAAAATDEWLESDEYFRLDHEERYEVDAEIDELKRHRTSIVGRVRGDNTINIVELAILRLNDVDDVKLIELLERLKEAFISNNDREISDEFIVELRTEIKTLLKTEWETVKSEVSKGGKVNRWRRNVDESFWK